MALMATSNSANCSLSISPIPSRPRYSSSVPLSSSVAFSSSLSRRIQSLSKSTRGGRRRRNTRGNPRPPEGMRVSCLVQGEPLKVMISGVPASGKGTQCEMIVNKYGLVHISAGDILRAEVAAGSEIGKKATDYMDNGRLVPDEIVTDMVVSLSREDVREKGWLLDGYPRSFSQAQSLEKIKIRPDIYIMLQMCWQKDGSSDWKDLPSQEFPSRDRGNCRTTYDLS